MNGIAQVLAGLFIGYFVVTVCESVYHRFGGHAPKKLRGWSRFFGPLGRVISDRWYSHEVIHHRATYRNSYIQQFSSREEEIALTNKLLSQEKIHIVQQSFGLRVGGAVEHIRYMLPTAPFIIIACISGGWLFSIGAVIPLIIMPLMSQHIHPLLHLCPDEAINSAPQLLKPFANSWYFRYIMRYHWLHHLHPDTNYNLMIGGDFLLGCHRSASPAEHEKFSRAFSEIAS